MREETNEKFNKIKKEISLSAKLNCIYAKKVSFEAVGVKLNNQFNSVQVSILKINPKFTEKNKKYQEINKKIMEVFKEYEVSLKSLSIRYDKQILELILKKAELEYKLLFAIIEKQQLCQAEKLKNTSKLDFVHTISHVAQKLKMKKSKKEALDVSLLRKMRDEQDINYEMNAKSQYSDEYKSNQQYISKLESEIKKLNKRIARKNEEKAQKIFDSMEVGNKELSTQIKKPHTFKNIKKFFVNRFNTYNVIMKTVIEPFERRIDEFKINELGTANPQVTEFELEELDSLIEEKFNLVFEKYMKKDLIIFQK